MKDILIKILVFLVIFAGIGLGIYLLTKPHPKPEPEKNNEAPSEKPDTSTLPSMQPLSISDILKSYREDNDNSKVKYITIKADITSDTSINESNKSIFIDNLTKIYKSKLENKIEKYLREQDFLKTNTQYKELKKEWAWVQNYYTNHNLKDISGFTQIKESLDLVQEMYSRFDNIKDYTTNNKYDLVKSKKYGDDIKKYKKSSILSQNKFNYNRIINNKTLLNNQEKENEMFHKNIWRDDKYKVINTKCESKFHNKYYINACVDLKDSVFENVFFKGLYSKYKSSSLSIDDCLKIKAICDDECSKITDADYHELCVVLKEYANKRIAKEKKENLNMDSNL